MTESDVLTPAGPTSADALAATAILREHLPELEVRFVDVVDLFRMQRASTLVIDVIDRVPGPAARAAHLKEEMKGAIIDGLEYAHTHGIDRDEITN